MLFRSRDDHHTRAETMTRLRLLRSQTGIVVSFESTGRAKLTFL